MDNKLKRLDSRHKLAVIMALVTWGISLFFSKEGFGVDNPKAQWLGWILASLVTTMELIFNSRTQKVPLTLISVGLICYGYGIWTNVLGFWTYQHPDISFVLMNQKSIMSVFVGLIMEILPEPLFLWGVGAEIEGDLIGNLLGLINGDLDYAKPGTHQPKPNNPVSTYTQFKPNIQNRPYDPKMVPAISPKWQSKHKKTDPRKVVSNLFLDNYTKKYKK